jgi:hypothetical protein
VRNPNALGVHVNVAVGNDIGLMTDANSYYESVHDAVYAGKGLEEPGVIWLEEPVIDERWQWLFCRKTLHIYRSPSTAQV